MRRLLAIWMTMLLLSWASVAVAQTFTVQSITPATMGNLAAAATGVTQFQIYGTTITIFGNGSYISGPQTTMTVTIACAGACNGATARIFVTRPGGDTGRSQGIADIGAVAIGPATIGGYPFNSAGTLDITMSGWTGPGTLQFQFGIRMNILGDDGSTATTASSQLMVAVANNPNTPTGGTVSTVSATLLRALRIAKAYDLRFGTVAKPVSGSFQVAISSINGARTTTPGSASGSLISSNYGAARYTITGEPGSSYSLSYPSSFTMTGPSSITVTTASATAAGSQTMPAGGSAILTIGGLMTVGSSVPTGAYSGSFTVTLAYN